MYESVYRPRDSLCEDDGLLGAVCPGKGAVFADGEFAFRVGVEIVACFVFGVIGAWIGLKVMKKHFVKAGIV